MHVCIDTGIFASNWVWLIYSFLEQCLTRRLYVLMWHMGVSLLWMIFYICHAFPLACQKPPSPGPSGRVELWAQTGWGRSCQSVRLCVDGVAPPTPEVGCGIVLRMWGKGIGSLACILVLSWLCCIVAFVCGLPVGCQWSVKNSLRMAIPEEQDGAVVGMCWPIPSGLGSGSLGT